MLEGSLERMALENGEPDFVGLLASEKGSNPPRLNEKGWHPSK